MNRGILRSKDRRLEQLEKLRTKEKGNAKEEQDAIVKWQRKSYYSRKQWQRGGRVRRIEQKRGKKTAVYISSLRELGIIIIVTSN